MPRHEWEEKRAKAFNPLQLLLTCEIVAKEVSLAYMTRMILRPIPKLTLANIIIIIIMYY